MPDFRAIDVAYVDAKSLLVSALRKLSVKTWVPALLQMPSDLPICATCFPFEGCQSRAPEVRHDGRVHPSGFLRPSITSAAQRPR